MSIKYGSININSGLYSLICKMYVVLFRWKALISLSL